MQLRFRPGLAVVCGLLMVSTGCGGVGPTGGASNGGKPETTGPVPEAASKDLLADAKEEGSLIWYSSKPKPVVTALANKFQDQYGIKMNVFKAGGSQILAKAEAELSSGSLQADVVDYSEAGAAVDQAGRGVLARFAPQGIDDVDRRLKSEHGYWWAYGWYTATIAYNPRLVSPKDAPKSWADLADPKWKGKVGFASPEYAGTAFMTLQGWKEKLGAKYLERIGPNLRVFKGFGDVENAILSGDTPVGVVLTFRSYADRAADKSIEVVQPSEGQFGLGDAMAINAKAKHPKAARLFANYILSDTAQKILTSHYQFPVRPGVAGPEGLPDGREFKLHFPDLEELADPKTVLGLKDDFEVVTG